MILMIGRGVTSGVATSTEVSAFAAVYALLVGGAAFRELTARSLVRLFVDSASMAGSILFIVAGATGFSFALTIQQIPQYLSDALISFGHAYGQNLFIVVATFLMIGFGSVLEGAPALIIWGPLLTPIAAQLGVHPLHFGTVMVIAMASRRRSGSACSQLARSPARRFACCRAHREVPQRPPARAVGSDLRPGGFTLATRSLWPAVRGFRPASRIRAVDVSPLTARAIAIGSTFLAMRRYLAVDSIFM
jgi:hypothetical protein